MFFKPVNPPKPVCHESHVTYDPCGYINDSCEHHHEEMHHHPHQHSVLFAPQHMDHIPPMPPAPKHHHHVPLPVECRRREDRVPPVMKCANCLYFERSKIDSGFCRFNPPAVIFNSEMNRVISIRPEVMESDFCSKFEGK